jgi:thioester reductase-like protein
VSGNYLVDQTNNNAKFSESDFYVGQNYKQNVYVRSKFEAESHIYKAVAADHLSATIFRVGNLTSRYQDGFFQINESENAFYNIIKSIIGIKAIPQNIINTQIEFTPVDQCSKAIIDLLNTKESLGRVFHIFNHKFLKMSDLLSIFKEIQINVDILDDTAFRLYIKELSEDTQRFNLLQGLVNDINSEKDLNFGASVIYEYKFTNEFLQMLGFDWGDIDINYISNLVKNISI